MTKLLCKVLGHNFKRLTPSGPDVCVRCGAIRKYRTNFRDRMETKGGSRA